METDYVNHGYEESRREQARLHEELAQREKALRETHIGSIHEVEEMKRAQEVRIDEFSRNELLECQATIQTLSSQMQELQENGLYERCYRISRNKFDLQSTGSCSKSLWDAEPRPKSAT